LIETLLAIKWMIDCCKGLGRIRDLLAEEGADLPDSKVIDPYIWQVHWWLPAWGKREATELTIGHIRLQPGEKN